MLKFVVGCLLMWLILSFIIHARLHLMRSIIKPGTSYERPPGSVYLRAHLSLASLRALGALMQLSNDKVSGYKGQRPPSADFWCLFACCTNSAGVIV